MNRNEKTITGKPETVKKTDEVKAKKKTRAKWHEAIITKIEKRFADRIEQAVLDEELIYYRRATENSLQETRDEEPAYFLHPFMHIRDELKKRNI